MKGKLSFRTVLRRVEPVEGLEAGKGSLDN